MWSLDMVAINNPAIDFRVYNVMLTRSNCVCTPLPCAPGQAPGIYRCEWTYGDYTGMTPGTVLEPSNSMATHEVVACPSPDLPVSFIEEADFDVKLVVYEGTYALKKMRGGKEVDPVMIPFESVGPVIASVNNVRTTLWLRS